MKSWSLDHLNFVRLFTLANVVFWTVFVVLFVIKSYPYRPHEPLFEERSPEFIYFGRALSVLENEQVSPLMKTTLAVQKPCFYAARPFFWYFNDHGITVDRLYAGVSVGGYYLLIGVPTFLFSVVFGWVAHRLRSEADEYRPRACLR